MPHEDVATDLTRREFTVALLDRTWEWRHRVVETVELGAAHHLRLLSSYQLLLTPDDIRPFLPDADPAFIRAFLPVSTRPKQPLLNFDMAGPSGTPAHLLPRSVIAAIEADYLCSRILDSGAAEEVRGALSHELLEAICVFTPAAYRRLLDAAKGNEEHALTEYLSDGLSKQVQRSEVASWRAQAMRAGAVLSACLPEGADPASSADNVLLALPLLSPPPEPDEIEELVRRFAAAIDALERAGERGLLTAIADYGRRWDVIAEIDVPVGTLFTVKLAEDLPIKPTWRGWIRHFSSMGDAASWHLQVRLTDPNLAIRDVRPRDFEGQLVGIPLVQGVRESSELWALYSADGDRPDLAEVSIQVRPALEIRATAYSVLVLSIGSLLTAVGLPADAQLIASLGLVAVPTTFAVALILIREQTSLASRLQRRPKLGALTATVGLWIATGWRLIT